MKKLVLVTALAVFVLRFFITPRLTHIPSFEMSYEAFAHLFVGGLIGVSWYDKKNATAALYGAIGWSLVIFELLMFLWQKFL